MNLFDKSEDLEPVNNLFTLAHHPKAFEARRTGGYIDDSWWGYPFNSTQNQFDLLYDCDGSVERVDCHTDEHEFRMHLLFVHWATSDVGESK